MDQNFKHSLKAAAFAIALMLMSACSSSKVEEGSAVPPIENAGEATTDAVPPVTDPNGPPVVEDPSLATPHEAKVAASNDSPPPVEDPNVPSPDLAMDIPTSVPADTSVVAANDPQLANPTMTDPAPIGKDDLASSPSDKPARKKGKKRHKGGKSEVAASGAVDTNGNYTVQRGDTLMKIAFEQYGDLYRWKEILEANRDRIQDPNHVPPGTHLKLSGAGMTTIEHNGERYLIKHGDTLGIISKDVYGNSNKWKRLWENNRQLIKDPNKIYAGFYLYYQPDGKLTHEATSEDGSAAVSKKPEQNPMAKAFSPAPTVVTAPAVGPSVPAAPRSPASVPVQK